MFSLAMRGLIALAATALLGVLWLNPWSSMVSGAPFSKVLQQLREADSLTLQIVREDTQARVWIRRPGLVRWEESPQTYQIAAGSRWWKVDESTNSVTAGDSPWFHSADQQVDLLALLDLGVNDAQPLLRSRPAEKTEYDGRLCVVYRTTLQGKGGRLEIEAFADEKTRELAGIVARPAGALRKTNPPLAELKLVAVNETLDESKFVVAKTLTEDGRIGKVSDAQGVVVIRPMLARRWTPICREVLLKPGDWLRTEIRGANAVKATLSSDVEITLGPGSLLECVSPTQARLHTGEAQVAVPKQKDASFMLLAPREGSEKFGEGKHLVRVDREDKLVSLKQQPLWLSGFEGTTNNESLGSLIVKLPDGRNEPLAVGYHKVSVEIRDQIARTTIEESFVNHTQGRLEGVFHFPLPQDASISGFGMWIGNDLVEADIVEKQRAREIYETILREKRDPGLLEWTSGNLFKARVFPIESGSEKRIKIVYTQVLPLRGNRYRYSYSLRSDLLQTRPLRELALKVTVNSALPLKSVTCPTHPARTQQTAHSAQVEFAAQEYTPSRDFELVCEIDGKQSDVVVVPHRRGDDGYFLLQLTPPGGEGDFQRELLPDGQPLNLVLLCDTSASMDSQKRQQQAEFVAAVLSSLSEGDRFNLAASDVGTVWAFPESVPATADNAGKAKAFLEERLSLGWTNLERAFDDVLRKSPHDAQVIYVGDGIVSAGESDPAAFVKRLGRLVGEKDGDAQRTFHAVTVGNIYEAVVLKGIAGIGGGSVRSISGDQKPQAVALELLNELAQPSLHDLNLEFRGLKVAAVYPERLPNLAAGTQQIIVGRYLPQGADQQGEVVVTGKRGKETVTYKAKMALKDAEGGNSFIPRLWARSHLDHLLQQGQSEAVRNEIIAMSEQFHIITPYTSLLVLETDADRERFGVKRRYEMRDGERFFAQGRDNAHYELLQQQMKRAGDWRIALRRQVLRDLQLLGRHPEMFQRQMQVLDKFARIDDDRNYPSSGAPYGRMSGRGGVIADFDTLGDMITSTVAPDSWDDDSGDAGMKGFPASLSLIVSQSASEPDGSGDSSYFKSLSGRQDQEFAAESLSLSLGDEEDRKKLAGDFEEIVEQDREALGVDVGFEVTGRLANFESSKKELFEITRFSSLGRSFRRMDDRESLLKAIGGRIRYKHEYGYPDYTSWLNTLFPPLSAPATKPAEVKDPETWSPEAIALSKSLLRTEWLAQLADGIELRRTSDTYDPRFDRRSSHNVELALYSPKAWLTRTLDPEDHAVIEFCNEQERGAYSRALLLGRSRKSVEQDLKSPPLPLEYFTLSPLHQSQRYYQARVEAAGENQVRLILTNKDQTSELRYLVDTARHVVLKLEQFQEGKLSSSTTYSDFVEVAGAWWATKAVIRDEEDRKISETTYDLKSLAPEQYQQRLDTELSAKTKVQFLTGPLPKLRIARQKTSDGSGDFNDHLLMVLHNALLQQWDEVLKHVDAIEKVAVDKLGVRWIRTMLLITMRRNEEARQRLIEEARKLPGAKSDDEIYQADFVLARAQSVCSPAELLEFVEIIKPVYDRQPAELNVMPRWENYLLSCHEGLGRHEEAMALRKRMAERAPWEIHLQNDFARRLAQAGQVDAGIAWLQQLINRDVKWSRMEDESLHSALAELYRNHARWKELLEFTTAWIGRKPPYAQAYQQHLSVLIYNDRLEAANALVEQWLRESRVERKLAADERMRLDAAISFAQGNAHNLSFYRMDPRWYGPLAETARYFVHHTHHFDVVERIFGYRFGESDAADQVRGYFLAVLQSELATLPPRQINYLVGATLHGRLALVEPLNGRKQVEASELPLEIWKTIAGQLRQRWSKTDDKDDKHLLGQSLKAIYAARFGETDFLPFLRERIATAHVDYKATYISELFEAVLSRSWTDALEEEAFGLLPQLSADDDAMARLPVQVAALYRLVDAMIANRVNAEETRLRDAGELHELTRTELIQKKVEIRKAAMSGVAARLAERTKADKSPLGPWLQIEQIWLDVRLDRNLPQVEEQCWQILGEAPPKQEEDDEEDLTPSQLRERFFSGLLRHRALMTIMNLAARKDAGQKTIDRAVKYIDAGIGQGSEAAIGWRMTKFRLLVALDRADDLERNLRDWIRADESTAPWRVMLGILVAERGKIEEAIRLFETAEKDKLLTASHYRLLADWYLVANQRQAHERSKLEAFKQLPEHYMANVVYRMCDRWNRHDLPLPSELDEDTLLAFRALFEKSASPESYLSQLRDLYAACRDFRLLQMLPDAMLGRSPQQVYGFLRGMESYVLQELRNEATADEILARIKVLRQSDRTPTDLRALDLLEALVERRSSEVLNQPGPHVEGCLAALRRAFEREWGEGEPRMMASLLHSLGTLRDPRLVDEQLRELRALQKMAQPGSRDHLSITNDLSNVLFWSYHRKDEAIEEMEAEVAGYLRANEGRWPYQDNEVLGSYVHLLEGANRHAAGEAVLKKQLAASDNAEQRKWLEVRLLSLYVHALENKGEVSLGAGDVLLTNAVNLGVKQILASADDNHRHNLVSRIISLFDTARRHKLPSTEKSLRAFAFETMPQILKGQSGQYRSTATAPVSVIAETLGHKAALQYVVERMEQYPQRYDIGWDNSWDAFGYELAHQRHEAAEKKEDLTELTPRVLKLAIAELKRELLSGNSRNQHIYHIGYTYYWSEKRDAFAKAAEEVYAGNRESGRRVTSIARYLRNGLALYARAVEMLLTAHRDGVLDESGQDQLVQYLHLDQRYAESIPILEGLMQRNPESIQHPTRLMVAYFHTKRGEQLRELLASTDAFFHQKGRWVEGNIAQLASACLACQLHEQAVGYFNEAIKQHQRSHPAAGKGDATLSSWYQQLAQAYSALGKTKEAVEAASAAVVCWGPRQTERADALRNLQNVLAAAKDLDAYVKHLDDEAEKTGQDSPILRKAIGEVYKSRGKFAQAIAQLQLSLALQPNDKEVHQSLIASFDALGQSDQATRQLLKQIDFDRHDLTLYRQLADRLKGNEAEAERAATSIIEAAPSEAENHTAFAERLQQRNRWDEAIPHWQKVAELRRLEPTGLLKLAEAQIHEKRWPDAGQTVDKLHKTEWPARFNNVRHEIRRLQEQLPK